jgi:hypothetical protein
MLLLLHACCAGISAIAGGRDVQVVSTEVLFQLLAVPVAFDFLAFSGVPAAADIPAVTGVRL